MIIKNFEIDKLNNSDSNLHLIYGVNEGIKQDLINNIYLKKTLNNIQYKELAFEKLKGHTEFWKGRIAAKDIPTNLSDCEENVCLKENEDAKGHDKIPRHTNMSS